MECGKNGRKKRADLTISFPGRYRREGLLEFIDFARDQKKRSRGSVERSGALFGRLKSFRLVPFRVCGRVVTALLTEREASGSILTADVFFEKATPLVRREPTHPPIAAGGLRSIYEFCV